MFTCYHVHMNDRATLEALLRVHNDPGLEAYRKHLEKRHQDASAMLGAVTDVNQMLRLQGRVQAMKELLDEIESVVTRLQGPRQVVTGPRPGIM